MLTVLWLESACDRWADLSTWPSQVPSTLHAALLKYGTVYNTAHSVCSINLCITHLTAQPTDFINVIVCFSGHAWQSASAVHSLVRHRKNQISIDFRIFYDFSSHFNYSYLHIYSDHLLFNSILNVLLIVHFLLIPVEYFRISYRLRFLRYIANDFLRQCIGLFPFTARPVIWHRHVRFLTLMFLMFCQRKRATFAFGAPATSWSCPTRDISWNN